MQLLLEEARESYSDDIVHECQSNSIEELEQNVARIVEWTEMYKRENQ